MRILVAINSCHPNRRFNQVIRDTWLRDLPNEIDCIFFHGASKVIGGDFKPDEILFPVNDSYEAMSLKTRYLCNFSLDKGYDFVYKTDTDTLVHPKNLLSSGFEQYDYMGGSNADLVPSSLTFLAPWNSIVQFASGGAGYWLSRKAMRIIADGPDVISPEDVLVAMLLEKQGIYPMWNKNYRWRPGEQVDNKIVSLHLSSALQKRYQPEMMYEQYKKMKGLETT